MSGGVIDTTFMEISKDSELVQCVTSYISKNTSSSEGSTSPSKKKQVLNY
jgi:hypothetical protein